MERIPFLLIPVLMAVVLVRLLLLPVRPLLKLGFHSACGFVCLWLLNSLSPFTGIVLPMNAVTVAVAGFFGLPGISLIALLEML